MEGKVIAVVVVAGVLGVTAIILGFAGEATRIKMNEVGYLDGYCYYPQSPAMALGIVATIFLLIHQIVITVGSGCFCCRSIPFSSTCGGISALICFIFSWVLCVIALALLIRAAAVNNVNYLISNSSTDNLCPIGKSGLFILAGVFCFLTVALSFISYVVLLCTEKTNAARKPNERAIPMAQPQLP